MNQRPRKGDRGEEGRQGPRGLPCKECVCMYKTHGTPVRLIKSGGSRTLTSEDSYVIIDTIDKCVLYLPSVPYVEVDSDDHYYHSTTIVIVPETGTHELRSSGCSINGIYNSFSLRERREHKAISCKEGWYVI